MIALLPSSDAERLGFKLRSNAGNSGQIHRATISDRGFLINP